MHLCAIDQAVEQVLSRLPAHIHMGLPLGLGKPNAFVNALYARVRDLPERQLTIYTALTLGRPPLGDGLQRRFLEPFVERASLTTKTSPTSLTCATTACRQTSA